MKDTSAYYDSWTDDEILRIVDSYKSPKAHPIADPEKVHEYLNQTKVWIDSAQIEHKIKDMDKRYLFNVLSWFENNYDRIRYTYEFVERLSDEYASVQPPIDKTPLIFKLKSRYKKLLDAEKP
jgi:hypothetical protein